MSDQSSVSGIGPRQHPQRGDAQFCQHRGQLVAGRVMGGIARHGVVQGSDVGQ
ncbi:hypothetical protein ABZ512_22870 [Nocardiopsis dassonvillei]|uniref:hypothetical protein n=1 Tax=Nocardiopsis dassonvillei TaxID=2014 RepID=UPI0033E7C8E5